VQFVDKHGSRWCIDRNSMSPPTTPAPADNTKVTCDLCRAAPVVSIVENGAALCQGCLEKKKSKAPPRDPIDRSGHLPIDTRFINTDNDTKLPEPPAPGASKSENDLYQIVSKLQCPVCLERQLKVTFEPCRHMLCCQCTIKLNHQEEKPVCHLCRAAITAFNAVFY
jgi:hypothetical protein